MHIAYEYSYKIGMLIYIFRNNSCLSIMHQTNSSIGCGSSSDRIDPTEVKFAKLRYFWEETSSFGTSHDHGNNSLRNVTKNTIDSKIALDDKVIIKVWKELKCIWGNLNNLHYGKNTKSQLSFRKNVQRHISKLMRSKC